MDDSKVFMFPDNNSKGNSSTSDLATLMALMNNGGGFGNGNWIWVIFMMIRLIMLLRIYIK